MHYYICIFFVLFGHFVSAEQHDIVWGQYTPPAISKEEVASALNTDDAIELKPLGGGFSGGHIYSFRFKNREYIARRTGGVFGQKGIRQEVALLHEANKEGLIPNMPYANPSTGLIIMEKIDNLLPSEFCPGLLSSNDRFLEQIADGIRKIQALRPANDEVTDRYDRYHVQKALSLVDISALPDDIQKMLRECISWPVEKEQAVNHNDLHMRNLLYDGEKIYFIDWECAGWGPKDADVANFCNCQVMTLDDGLSFYARYLKRMPTREEKLHFSRQRVLNAAANGMHGYSHWKPGRKNPLENLASESPLETVRNLFFSLDRGKIDLREEAALAACGLAWLSYAAYLNQ